MRPTTRICSADSTFAFALSSVGFVSGTHKQKDDGKGNGSNGQAPPKTLDHAFVTPRVKSAAKSRQAVALLNKIVGEKDSLLKRAISNMERKEKTLLTSKNNDFLKFVSTCVEFPSPSTKATTKMALQYMPRLFTLPL